ncbi:inovirus-type Gp2 protein [uncultured Mailhella sp.]|uniref:YagK/YfjJ domain-containing protein n=1 Tax=uncultured Mailhella sp. TaxID=1981031 RepID=UPI00261FF7AB|nr:inovirus-type Gp2 protein [uncultured Mailhella sp.]
MKENITFLPEYNNHPINTDINKKQGCYEKALDKIESTFNSMLDQHSKVMVVRFDVRYPNNDNIQCNKNQVYDFTYNLKRSLNREKIGGGHKVDAKLMYVEEQDKSIHKHYHFNVIVNANAKNKSYPILQKAERLWKKSLGTEQDGLIDFCSSHENGIIIDKNSDDFNSNYNKAFYQVSYLAKVRGKENRDKGSWLIKTSR